MELARWRARCSREGHYLRDVLEAMVFLTLLSGGPHYRKCTASNVNPPPSPKKNRGGGLCTQTVMSLVFLYVIRK